MPRDAVSQSLQEAGGIVGMNAPSDIPRNRNQVAHYRTNYGDNKSKTDELATLVHMANSKDTENSFVRSVAITPEKSVFCATDRQLKDVERFCTKANRFCILGVDPTYNLGPCYVTLTTYRHLLFRTKDGQHPVMLGPLLLHTGKTYDSYFPLPSNMIKFNRNLNGILVTGTDAEENVFRPFNDLCNSTINQYCSIHLHENVKSQLSNIPSMDKNQIFNDLFGSVDGDYKVKGVVDAEGEIEFEEFFTKFCQKWAKYPEFIAYIIGEKEEVMKTSMRADIRSICGLGYPPATYNQNANECMNRWVKDKLTNPLKSFTDVVHLLEKEIRRQDDQIFLSLSGTGEWTLDSSLKGSRFDIGIRYFQKTVHQRKGFLKAFNDYVEVPQILLPSENSGEQLSIAANDSGLLFPPMEVLQPIFKKAANYIKDLGNAVVKAPGVNKGLYFVASRQNSNQPHKVATLQRGNISCDCQNYKSYNICSHTLVVAEMESVLGEFLKAVKRKKRTIDGVINRPDSGKKKKATQVRRGRPSSSSKRPQPTFAMTTDTPIPRYPDPEMGTFELALLYRCHGNTKKCYSCPNAFRDFPVADILLVSKCHRVVGREADGTFAYSTEASNVFFHARETCIKKTFPEFTWQQVTIFEPHRQEILQDHYDFLRRVGVV